MKKDYKKPEMTVSEFDVKDIITESTGVVLPDENGDMVMVGDFFEWFSAE